MKSKLLYIVLIVLFACSSKKQIELKGNSENIFTRKSQRTIFRDIIGGYEIDFPNYWNIEDLSQTNQMIRADIYKDSNVGFQIRMYKIKDFETFKENYIRTSNKIIPKG